MTITFNADWLSKIMTALLAAAGTLQYFDWINFFALVSPEHAAGIVALVNGIKLAVNAWTKATTVTIPKAEAPTL